jgi:hypothetical protein
VFVPGKLFQPSLMFVGVGVAWTLSCPCKKFREMYVGKILFKLTKPILLISFYHMAF